MANPKIIMTQVFPSQAKSLKGPIAMKAFQTAAQISRLLRGSQLRLAKCRIIACLLRIPGEANSVQARLCAPTTGREVKRSVWAKIRAGYIEWPAGYELFKPTAITRPVRSQVNDEDFPVRPVEDEQRISIGFREMTVRPESNGSRRAQPDIEITW